MVNKTIKKHDFISGSPVLDENITYGDYVLSLEEPSIINNITLTNKEVAKKKGGNSSFFYLV